MKGLMNLSINQEIKKNRLLTHFVREYIVTKELFMYPCVAVV